MSTPLPGGHPPPHSGSIKLLTDPKISIDAWLRSSYLQVEDGAANVPLTVKDYINYLRSATPDTAFFTTEMVDWALEAVRIGRRITKSSSTYIAPVTLSHTLFSIAMGWTKDEVTSSSQPTDDTPTDIDRASKPKTLQEQYPDFYTDLQGKRFIFLPVNNGFASEVAQMERWKAQKDALEKEETRKHDKGDTISPKNDVALIAPTDVQAPSTSAASLGHRVAQGGTHWSFIVIDTTAETVRYIDSLVTTKRLGRKKYRITNIDWNAPVAGKILRGFEIFMKRERGRFDARTLKWVPNQGQNNKSRNDAGACGPYVYALVDFILQHRKTLLGTKGLKGYFNETERDKNFSEIAFDSGRVRERLQNQLQTVRLSKEAKARTDGKTFHPDNLDPETLLSVLNPDVLRQLSSGQFLKKLLDIHDPPKTVDIDDVPLDLETAKRLEAEWMKSQAGKATSHANKDLDQDLLRVQIWSTVFPHLDIEEANPLIDDFLRQQGDKFKASEEENEWSKRQDFAILQGVITEKLPNAAFRDTVWGANQQLRVDYRAYKKPRETSNSNLRPFEKHPRRNAHRNRLTCPDGITSLPDDFADDKEVTGEILEQWKTTNADLLGRIFPSNIEETVGALSYRAALQACSGQSFVNETKERIEKIWAFDSYAVTQNMGWSCEVLRLRLRQTYEDLDNLSAMTDSGDDLDDDDDDADEEDSHDKGKNKTNSGKETEGRPDAQKFGKPTNNRSSNQSSKAAHRHYFNQGSKRKRNHEEKEPMKKRKVVEVLEETDPKKIDWGTISSERLQKWITDEVRNDPRIRTAGPYRPNNYTYRAILFVTHGYRFAHEAQYRFRDIWFRDRNAFHVTQGCDPKEIRLNQDGSLDSLSSMLDLGMMQKRMIEIYDPKMSGPKPGPGPVSTKPKQPTKQQRSLEQATNNSSDSKATTSARVIVGDVTYLIPSTDKRVSEPARSSTTALPKGFKHIPDFANCTAPVLGRWVRGNSDVADHEEANSKHSRTTSRAMLHVKYKGTFLHEPDANMQKEWVYDTMVFDKNAGNANMPPSKIRHALMAYYEPETLEHIKQYELKKRPAEGSGDESAAKKAKMS